MIVTNLLALNENRADGEENIKRLVRFNSEINRKSEMRTDDANATR